VNNAWEKFFSDHAIQPYCVTYESLVKNYQQSIVRLLDSLGIDRLPQTQLRSPRLKRQSDTVNEEWARRFREDLMSTEQPNSGQ
jgi:LPS sulfotransferase NodH